LHPAAHIPFLELSGWGGIFTKADLHDEVLFDHVCPSGAVTGAAGATSRRRHGPSVALAMTWRSAPAR